MTTKVKFKPNKDVYRVNLSPREATLVYSLLSLVQVDNVRRAGLTDQNGTLDLDAKIAQNLCLSISEVLDHHAPVPKIKFVISTHNDEDFMVDRTEFENTKCQDLTVKFS